MHAIKLKARIGADAALEWLEPLPDLPPGEVEIIVLYERVVKPSLLLPTPLAVSNTHDLTRQFDRLCAAFSITETTVDIAELQRDMGAAELEANELSRDLIAMRDE